MNELEFLNHTHTLAFVKRYGNRHRINDESVAEHSFFVALIVIKLYEEYDFNLESALVAALSHDVPEADISDVTHGIKKRHVQLASVLLKAEIDEIQKYPNKIQEGYATFQLDSMVEGLIAQLADVLQVRQYIQTEYNLGNATMQDIHYTTVKRIGLLRERLHEHRRDIKR